MTDLHLPSLAVAGFRCIEELRISRLGQVSLLTGRNGVGKTTLLEALRIYAARGDYPVLAELLSDREELEEDVDDDGDEVLIPDWSSLFFGRTMSENSRISVGPHEDDHRLVIKPGTIKIEDDRQRRLMPELMHDVELPAIEVEFGGESNAAPLSSLNRYSIRYWRRRSVVRFRDRASIPEIGFSTFGPGLPSNRDLARNWDRIALTADESRAVDALCLALDNRVERVAAIGDDGDSRLSNLRRLVVKLRGDESPVPLKSLGDGAVRVLGVTLALINSKGGILAIDEVENGVHHSIQQAFWELILRTAKNFGVQVLASTHSWDCVRGFALAAARFDEADVALIRIEDRKGRKHVVEYTAEDLGIAAEQGVEVR